MVMTKATRKLPTDAKRRSEALAGLSGALDGETGSALHTP